MNANNAQGKALPEDDTTARSALLRYIVGQLTTSDLSFSELKTVAVRVERLCKAVRDYGHLDLATDRRNWKLEGAYEGVDRQWYEDANLVFDHDPAFAGIRALREAEKIQERRERLRCFIADEQFKRVDVALGELIEATFEVRDGQLHEIVPPGSEVLP
jgi:hypothetical protein